MSYPKFTPGPWVVGTLFDNDGNVPVKCTQPRADESVRVCMVDRCAPAKRGQGWKLADDAERNANARLIAAAPALYEALERLAGHAEFVGSTFAEGTRARDNIDAAIAFARTALEQASAKGAK